MDKRVVITGMGIISPIGIGNETFWNSLIDGKSGIKKIQGFDTSCYSTSFGGEVIDFSPSLYLDVEEIQNLDRACQFILTTTKLAIEDARLDPGALANLRAGVLIGSTTATNYSNYHNKWALKGYESVTYRDILRYRCETIPNCIAIKYKTSGVSALITNACAAGTYSIGQSFKLIKSGKADVMISGGTESMSESAVCGFSNTRSLAKEYCRPFDKDRDGLLVAEGAATLILESFDNAIARGAHIYAEVVGYGLSCDADHMTAPDVSGESAALAMKKAICEAGLSTYEIDYINAHGTGTSLNDKMETNAAKIVFGKHAYNIPMSSIKSMIGHTFGASGAIEALTCASVLEKGIIPPTINYYNQDPECDLDYVPNKSIKRDVKTVISNSFAFGGNNASLILKKFNS